MSRRPRRWFAALAMVMLTAACSDNSSTDGSAPDGDRDELAAVIAGFDLAVGPPARFLVGLFSEDHGNVGYGTVSLRFSYLGTAETAERDGSPSEPVTASFLPVPGSEPAEPRDGPVFVSASEGRGVYAAEAGFDRAGFWEVEVSAEMVGVGRRAAVADFEVHAEHAVLAPGEPAPASDNLTLASTGVPAAAIDSRALDDAPVPDPELHQTTIAAARRDHRPALVVFSTPTFCVSRFCGPVTDVVAELAAGYGDRASFIHIEIWRDFENQQLNDTAAEWLVGEGGEGNEPWVFLIGADGRIAARWDNVATRGEIEPLLQALPVIGAVEGVKP